MLCPLILSQIAFVAAARKANTDCFVHGACRRIDGIALMFKQVAIVNWFYWLHFIRFSLREKSDGDAAVSFVAWSATGLLAVLALSSFTSGGVVDCAIL